MEMNRAMDVYITSLNGQNAHTKAAIAYDMTITGKNRRNGLFFQLKLF